MRKIINRRVVISRNRTLVSINIGELSGVVIWANWRCTAYIGSLKQTLRNSMTCRLLGMCS